MSENLIDYSNFQPDWWDAAGVTAEAVKTEISRLIDSTFGVGGISAIQKAAIEASSFRNYESQQAMKAAGDAAVRALSYADQPNSVLFRDALASRIAYENIAKTAAADAGQILKNAGADITLASKLTNVANALGPVMNIAQLGAAGATGDAYVVAQKAAGVLAGMAFGAAAVGTVTGIAALGSIALGVTITSPLWLLGGAAIVAGFAGGKVWEWMWDNGAAEYYGVNKGDKFDIDRIWGGIVFGVNSLTTSALNWVAPRRDPLVLDLDGNGITTSAINPAAPILFDQDGDGTKTATGWIAAGEAIVVRDLNGNGTIDSGRELFGDNTILTRGPRAGQLATNGFEALADLDSNGDGKFNSLDADFASVKLWKDLNQDGISQSGELFTFAQLGVASINVAGTASNVNLGGGNTQTFSGSFTKTDGATGNNGTAQLAGSLLLANNNFYRQFTDDPALTTAAQALPQMHGSGLVRDLRPAMSLGTAQAADLQAKLTQFAADTTHDQQMAHLDALVQSWGNTSMQTRECYRLNSYLRNGYAGCRHKTSSTVRQREASSRTTSPKNDTQK